MACSSPAGWWGWADRRGGKGGKGAAASDAGSAVSRKNVENFRAEAVRRLQAAKAGRQFDNLAAVDKIKISKIAPDYVTKGVHIHVYGVELKVLPGAGGKVVFKPVFNAQEKIAGTAIKQAEAALQDIGFRRSLHEVAQKATDYLKKSGLQGAAATSGETRFLYKALENMGL